MNGLFDTKSFASSKIHKAVIDKQNKVTNYLFESVLINKIGSTYNLITYIYTTFKMILIFFIIQK